MTAAILGITVVGFIIFLAVGASKKAKAARLDKLRAIAAFLGGEHDESGKAWGTKLGPKTTLEFATRGSGSSSESWTHVHVAIPAAYPLAIHVRRHEGSDRSKVARGDMVDLVIGDPSFDEEFLIEAAPGDVVRELLDPEIRLLLSEHKEIDLETIQREDGSRAVTLGIRGWLEDLELVRRPLEVMAKLGARVRDAYATADAAIAQATAGDPYRPVADDQPVRDAQAAREAEVGQVQAVRARRAAEARAVAIAVLVVIGLVTAFALAASLH